MSVKAVMSLKPEEIDRYKRHLVLHDVGGQGQQKLKAAKVLIVGAGGLGSPILMYLAAAGVGTIGIIDDDHVSLDNLQRQIAHDTRAVGIPKVDSAKRTIARINPHVTVITHNMRLDHTNAIDIISRYDIIADGSDNFETRYLVSDACYLAKRTLIFAAVGPFDGYVTTFKPHETMPAETGPDDAPGQSGQESEQEAGGHSGGGAARKWPTYRCIFPEAPPPGTVANCSEVGVLGVTVGVVGTLQATEIIKEILGLGESLAGRLLIYDARAARFQEVKISWDPDNPLSGTNPTIFDLSIHAPKP